MTLDNLENDHNTLTNEEFQEALSLISRVLLKTSLRASEEQLNSVYSIGLRRQDSPANTPDLGILLFTLDPDAARILKTFYDAMLRVELMSPLTTGSVDLGPLCPHERLNEDGICLKCGGEFRGAQQIH